METGLSALLKSHMHWIQHLAASCVVDTPVQEYAGRAMMASAYCGSGQAGQNLRPRCLLNPSSVNTDLLGHDTNVMHGSYTVVSTTVM